MMRSPTPEQKIAEVEIFEIPYLPRAVDPNDLIEMNGKLSLHSATDLQTLHPKTKNNLAEAATKRFRKTELRQLSLPDEFGVITSSDATQDSCHALYKGMRQKREIGAGTFGIVKAALNINTFEWTALKIQSQIHTTEERRTERPIAEVKERGNQEYAMLAKAGVAYAVFESTSEKKGYQHNILTQLAKGEEVFLYCQKLAHAKRKHSDIQMLQLASGMCLAIHHLHEHCGIVHGDIKTENFMYDAATGEVRIIDFGIAMELNDQPFIYADEVKGTAGFIAPEIFRERRFSKKSDIYALGYTLSELLKLGYFDNNQQLQLYSENDYGFKAKPIIQDFSVRKSILRYIRKHMLAENPELRPEVAEVVAMLNDAQKKYPLLTARTISIGILNIGEYQHADPTQRQILVDMLCKFNRVLLIDQKKRSTKLYFQLRSELVGHGVAMGNHVYINANKIAAITAIPTHLEQTSTNAIYAYFYVSRKKIDKLALAYHRVTKIKPSTEENIPYKYFKNILVSIDQYDILQNNLKMETTRLLTINTEPFISQAVIIAKMAMTFTERFRNKELSYEDIYSGLIDLQSCASISRCVGNFFTPPPASLVNKTDTPNESPIMRLDSKTL